MTQDCKPSFKSFSYIFLSAPSPIPDMKKRRLSTAA